MAAQKQFFILLRTGLWGGEANTADFPENTDWKAIFSLARQQTVEAIICDGLATLPANLQPEPALLYRWYAYTVKIEQSHELLNQRLLEIITFLQSEGLHPVLLKGQGIAQNYPIPNHRHCGDIDIYLNEKEYKTGYEAVQKLDINPEDEPDSIKHYHFKFKGVDIELHRMAAHLNNPIRNKRFQRWAKQHLSDINLRRCNIGKVEVLLPPVNFDILFIFIHTFHHFIFGGVGLRQLCDWAICLHRFNSDIDLKILKQTLKSFGLVRAWNIFGFVAVKYLGLPEAEMPFYIKQNPKTAEKILSVILKDGNFGYYGRTSKPSKIYLIKKLQSLIYIQKRLCQLFYLFPKETVTYSIMHFIIGIRQVLTDWIKK